MRYVHSLPRTRPSLSKFVPPIIPAASLVLLAQQVSQSPISVIVSGVFVVESFPREVLSRPLPSPNAVLGPGEVGMPFASAEAELRLLK